MEDYDYYKEIDGMEGKFKDIYNSLSKIYILKILKLSSINRDIPIALYDGKYFRLEFEIIQVCNKTKYTKSIGDKVFLTNFINGNIGTISKSGNCDYFPKDSDYFYTYKLNVIKI